VAEVQGSEYPDHLYYDVGNQIWYEALPDGTVRAGFTPWAASMMGGALVFTPKRVGRDFDKGRSFAVIEGGKWVGSARAAFEGSVVAHNEALVKKPEMLSDGFGDSWMVIVRPAREDWQEGLITGEAIVPAFAAWMQSEAYKDRTE